MKVDFDRVIWIIAAIFFVLNIWVASTIGLTDDGSHYALYGEHLAWSYFDHPPLVGWLQALVLPLGHYDIIMRIWPLLLSLLIIISLYFITCRMISRTAAIAGVIIFYSAVILNLLAIDLLPQTPFLLFSLWTAYALYLISQQNNLSYWIVLGVCVGLACLSEYTALFLGIGIILYVLLFQPRYFLSYKPYVAFIIALACVSPVIIWNAQHQWISFYYQLNHGLAPSWAAGRFLQSFVLQLVVYGLVLFIFGSLGFWYVLRGYWQDISSRIFICLALPILLLFFYSGGHERILPHWPAAGWLLTIPLAARYIVTHWRRTWVKVIVIITAVETLTVYIILYSLVAWHWIAFPIGRDPLNDVYGWQQVGTEAKQLALQYDSTKPQLFASAWALAGRLAWYANLPVQVISGDKLNQFYLWSGYPDEHSNGVLVSQINWPQPPATSDQTGNFAHCQLIKTLPIMINERVFNEFYFYHCWQFNLR